jgi:hypothetical protein
MQPGTEIPKDRAATVAVGSSFAAAIVVLTRPGNAIEVLLQVMPALMLARIASNKGAGNATISRAVPGLLLRYRLPLRDLAHIP